MINYHFSWVLYLTVRLCSRQHLNFGMHLKDGIPLALGLMMSCKLAEEEGNQSLRIQMMEGTVETRTEIWCCPEQKLIIRFWILGMIWLLGTLDYRTICMAPQGPIVAYPKIAEPWRGPMYTLNWPVVGLLRLLMVADLSLVLDVGVVLLVLVHEVIHDLGPAVGQFHFVLACT